MDAQNVDDLISNLDQLGLLPWDKTQVCILKLCFMRHIICICWVPQAPKLPELPVINVLIAYFPLLASVLQSLDNAIH